MTADDINNFFSFLHQGRLGSLTLWLELVAGVVTSALLALMVIIMIKFRELYATAPPPAEAAAPVAAGIPPPWAEVMQKIESSNPSDWNIAVIRADSILDSVLQGMGLSGDTMGERLKGLQGGRLASLDDAWEAHKLRNRIAHEAERVFTYQEARRAILLFGRVLQELRYLKE